MKSSLLIFVSHFLFSCFCNCNPGFEGQSCSEVLPTGRTPQPISPDNCTLNCGDHGNMVRGSCSCLCDEGYSGSTCASEFSSGVVDVEEESDNDISSISSSDFQGALELTLVFGSCG